MEASPSSSPKVNPVEILELSWSMKLVESELPPDPPPASPPAGALPVLVAVPVAEGAASGAGVTSVRTPPAVSVIAVNWGEMLPVVARTVGLAAGPTPLGSVATSK